MESVGFQGHVLSLKRISSQSDALLQSLNHGLQGMGLAGRGSPE